MSDALAPTPDPTAPEAGGTEPGPTAAEAGGTEPGLTAPEAEGTEPGPTAPVELSLYEAAGGMPFFVALVDAFYEGVVTDAVLLPLYALDDIAGARHRLTLFLAQYWGGPTTYNDERGHPKLRMRHMPFRVGPAERDHWLLHMAAAVDQVPSSPQIRQALMAYFVPSAEHLRNDTGLPISSARTR